MKPTGRLLLRTSLALIMVLSVVFSIAPRAHAFDQSMLMSDSMFDNTGTMSAGDIDSFLNKYSSSCISLNHGFRAPDPTGYSPSSNFTYSGDVSAGTVIYDAAQAYGLNPQVILATLQKEQSLVTGDAGCSTNRYVGAMGNGCPDSGGTYSYSGYEMYSINGVATTSTSGTCVNSQELAGFSRQIIVAAWRLKFWEQRAEGNTSWAVIKPGWDNSDDPPTCYPYLMTQGYRARCQHDTPTYFDGIANIDGNGITLTNGATAALYVYTPHLHGNQNFVTIFENTFGFGSTTSGQLSIAHPNGTLVRPANSPAVYLIGGGKAQYATSLAVLQSWGYNLATLKIASQGDLTLMAATDADTGHASNPAPLQFRVGTLVKGSAPTIYVVENDVNGNNQKESLVDWNNFTRLGYNFNRVFVVPDPQLPATTGPDYDSSQAAHPDGSLVRTPGDNTVYYMVAGGRHSMTSLAVFYGQRFDFNQVVTATAGDQTVPVSWPVTWYAAGTVLRGSGPTVYISDLDNTGVNQSKRNFVTYYNFVGLGYNFNQVMQVSDNQLPSTNGPNIGQ